MPSKTNTILLVDDSYAVLSQLMDLINAENHVIHTTHNVDDAIERLANINPQLVIVSIEPEQMAELAIINWIRKHQLPIAVIAVSTDPNSEVAASAVRAGATDFLKFPASPERLSISIEQSIQRLEAENQSDKLDHPIYDESALGFIGAGKSMLEVSKLIISAAKSDASVFITGENGTGKEVCAQLIHQLSKRCDNQIVPLNCAAIPKDLAESEVFGHVKGAFTGAHADRLGVAGLADKGTMFLDEIGEMDLDLQTKLLRFLQTGTFNRVGSGELQQVNTRFICATNRDPYQQIAEGLFREDLFYRLNVIQIHLPPLRNRGDDIPVFAQNFLEKFAQEEGKRFKAISEETETLLRSYSWPGNVRELQNVMRSIVVLHDGETVIPSMLPLSIIREKGERRRKAGDSVPPQSTEVAELKQQAEKYRGMPAALVNYNQIVPLDDLINHAIEVAINECNGNVVEAAMHLQVSASTLYRKLKTRNREQRRETAQA
ncbi:sigma-54 dependent transcriptional regulator [Oceanicoccus sp. KOV_DT_Chl]|uniref:sigma-54-dependent transcriptional regulator n=1 Tax=Oceanicoccus sp. KOV_DT_Chl TaxID=1904639 RepID=UPI000C7BF030|nr:sigma-54 dependent transcriptional regulator [Oceanicoccus sp. KOV_DT_Chl]